MPTSDKTQRKRQQQSKKQQQQQKQRQRKRTQQRQRGGNTTTQSVQQPMQYFNPDHQSTYAIQPPRLEPSAYGESHAVSHGMSSCKNMVGPSLAPSPGASDLQTGGMMQLYSKIVNPMTGRKVSVTSATGRRVLQSYLNEL